MACGPWAESLEVTASDATVLARHTQAWRRGVPAIVQRGGLVYVGASGNDVWTWLVGRLTGGTDHGPGVEVFARPDGHVRIDHDELTVEFP